jgi:hypothetical protein
MNSGRDRAGLRATELDIRPPSVRTVAAWESWAYDRAMASPLRTRRAAFWLATGAVAWAAAFTVWVLTASFYQPGGETILAANDELIVRIALFVPLVTSAIVWLALHVACRNDNRAARSLGLTAASILLVFAILTGFTIATFVLPGAIALTAAAAMTPVGARPTGRTQH